MCKQINFKSFKKLFTYNIYIYIYIYNIYIYIYIYIYWMCANKWLIVNRIICVRQKYLKPFNCVHKMSSGAFKKCSLQNVCRSYLMYIYIQDLALNNLQWLICHKTQPNQNKIHLAILEEMVNKITNRHQFWLYVWFFNLGYLALFGIDNEGKMDFFPFLSLFFIRECTLW